MNQAATARDYMTRDVITITPDMDIHLVIKLLVEKKISGTPVVDDSGSLVGIVSTRDCLKVAFNSSYHQDRGGRIADYMSENVETIDAGTDIVEVAELFLKSRYRRFPVMEKGRLVGLISRYDALAAIEDLW